MGVALTVATTGVVGDVPDAAVSAGCGATLEGAGEGAAVDGCCDGVTCATDRALNGLAGGVVGVEVAASGPLVAAGADGVAVLVSSVGA